MTRYVIVDESTAPEIKGRALVQMVMDIRSAYDQDFAPVCGTLPIDLTISAAAAAPPDARIMHLVDVLDDAQALAYHTIDDQGRPVLRLGVSANRAVGGSLLDSISESLSHEIFETERNPFINRYLAGPWSGKKVADEACDPVQGTGFRVGSTLISNFTLPAWGDASDKDGPYDHTTSLGHMKVLSAPFECYPMGYLAFDDGTQIFGEMVHPARRASLEKYGRTSKE